MSLFDLRNPSRRKTVKLLTIGNYSLLVIDIVQGFVFVPLYLNYLGERLYGLWLGTGGVLAVLAFLDMGIGTLVIQRISHAYGKRNMDGISTYYFSGLLINVFFMSILLIAGYTTSFYLGSFFKQMTLEETKVLTVAFQIGLLALILTLMNNIISGTLNALQKPLFGIITINIAATLGLITTYIMLVKKETVIAIPAGIMVRSVFSILPNIVYLLLLFSKNHIKMFSLRWVTLKDYLLLTPNLLLSKVGTSLVGNIEPTLINIFLTPEIAVYYSVTKKAGGLIRSIIDRIGSVLYASVSHLFSENKQKFTDLLMKLFEYILIFNLILFLIYYLLNEYFIEIWVGAENYLGDMMTILIAASLLLSSLSNITSYLLSTTGDIKYTSNSVFFESMLKLTLLYILLRLLGVYGLPLAIIISSLIFLIIYILRWQKHLLLNKSNMKIFRSNIISNNLIIIGATILVYFISKSFLVETSIYSFMIHSILVFIIYSSIILFIRPELSALIKNKYLTIFKR